MSNPLKGSILISTGTGKYTVHPPGQNNQILAVDNEQEFAIKYIDIPTGPTGPTGCIGSTGPRGSTGSCGGEVRISFVANNTTSYLSYNNTSYRAISEFYYAGSSAYGTSPSQFTVISSPNTTNGAFNARLVDLTNSSNVIATIDITGADTTIRSYSTATFTNVTTTPAIWELQFIGKGTGGSNTSTKLYSMYGKLA